MTHLRTLLACLALCLFVVGCVKEESSTDSAAQRPVSGGCCTKQAVECDGECPKSEAPSCCVTGRAALLKPAAKAEPADTGETPSEPATDK